MWSYPDGKVLMEARGSVIAVDQDQIRVRREDGVVLPGSSGGAVLNEAGEVVGILQGMGEYEGESRVVAGTIEAAMKGCPLQR
jgi:S1-C subfamily serine protease